MAKEIERKFLVTGTEYRAEASARYRIIQAYLSRRPESTVRVRIMDRAAFLTVKGKNKGAVRDEWEYPIPLADAEAMISRCADGTVIDKTRYIAGRWEIDEFHGTLEGLTLAEIELTDADEPIDIPPYIGIEVTGDPRYYNSMLTAPPAH